MSNLHFNIYSDGSIELSEEAMLEGDVLMELTMEVDDALAGILKAVDTNTCLSESLETILRKFFESGEVWGLASRGHYQEAEDAQRRHTPPNGGAWSAHQSEDVEHLSGELSHLEE
jgi:hypothetical protein